MRAAFVTPPPGLAPLTDFHLEEVTGAQGLFTLTAAEEPAVRLFLLDAATYVPHYSPRLSEAQREVLGPDVPEAHLFVVANPGPGGTSVDVRNPAGERLTLSLEQPGRRGGDGIWVVTAERS